MAVPHTIDVGEIVDNQKFSRLNATVLVTTLLLMAADGYDNAAVAYSAPALMKAWHIPNIGLLGPVLSANMFGFWLGAPLFGYIGDRFGRKTAIILSTFAFGLFSLAAVQAGSLTQMMWLRVLAGVGLSGLFPLGIAINNEFAPKSLRATLVVLLAVGASFGGIAAGPVAAWLTPTYGWQIMFWIGGLVPMAFAVLAYFALPESIKFLALHRERRREVAKLLRRLAPNRHIPEDANFVIRNEPKIPRVSVKKLFEGKLAAITTLVWLSFMIVGMSYYFFSVWMVTILHYIGLPIAKAAISGSMYQIGGIIGALALCRPMDKYGLKSILVLFVLCVPTIAAFDLPNLSTTAIFAIMLANGIAILGLKSVINAAAGLIYPTALRASGVGWAVGMGAVGSVVWSSLAGILISNGLSISALFVILSVLMVIGTITWYAITRLCAAMEVSSSSWVEGAAAQDARVSPS